MKNSIFLLIGMCFMSTVMIAQSTVVEGYVFEDGNRGYLNQVSVNVFEEGSDRFIKNVRSDIEGFFTLELDAEKTYRLEAMKDIFEKKTLTFITDEKKVFLKVPMMREEGYLFEVTLAPKRENEDQQVDAITSALIEVYNNTTQEEVLVLQDHPTPDFKVHFKKGNHYTVMVRKEGYLVKRMEAFVNVEGCILCFEGVGEVRPGVADNLTEGMSMGTLLANVEMESLYEGKIIELQNVYYEFGKAELTKQAKDNLKQLGSIMKDNAQLNVELGSHTDVRGTGPDNRSLSERRAQSAVDYLTGELLIDPARIIAKGYGESQIKNKCLPGVTCTEAEHAENRRTEIKILDMDEGAVEMKSLASMKVEENFMKQLLEGGGAEQVSYQELAEKEQVSGKEIERPVAAKSVGKKKTKLTMGERKGDDDGQVQMDKNKLAKELLQRKKEKAIGEKKLADDQKALGELEDEEQVAVKENESVIENKVDRAVGEESGFGFSGYRVVIHFSNFPISGDHEIYQEFDDIESYRTTQKNMLYMVGAFKKYDDALAYHREEIEKKYPSSYVVGFLNGNRIKLE